MVKNPEVVFWMSSTPSLFNTMYCFLGKDIWENHFLKELFIYFFYKFFKFYKIRKTGFSIVIVFGGLRIDVVIKCCAYVVIGEFRLRMKTMLS